MFLLNADYEDLRRIIRVLFFSKYIKAVLFILQCWAKRKKTLSKLNVFYYQSKFSNYFFINPKSTNRSYR
jgi:hypothetical protein